MSRDIKAVIQPKIEMKSSLFTALQALYKRRELISELVKRDLRDRHAGQVLGVVWAYGNTLLLMAMYTLLFAYVFPTRFSNGMGAADFSVNILAGILSWLAFQDILSRSPTILVGHSNLVKQIVFPTEVLPVKAALASALPYSAALFFTIAYAHWKGTLSWFALTLPFIVFWQVVAMNGVALLLSSLGVFSRDLKELVAFFCVCNLFAQPILYNPHATPEWLEWIFLFNPFSYLVWCWQDALYYGQATHLAAWVLLPAGSLLLFALGYKVFESTKHLFGDAL